MHTQQIVVIGAGQSSVLPLKTLHDTAHFNAQEAKKSEMQMEIKSYGIEHIGSQYEYFPLPLNYINGKTLPKLKK